MLKKIHPAIAIGCKRLFIFVISNQLKHFYMAKKYRKKEVISVKYSLRTDGYSDDGKTPVPINLNANFNGKRFKYSTGFKIAPNDWVSGNYKTSGRPKRYVGSPRLRKRLKDLDTWLNEFYQANEKEINLKALRLELDYKTGRKERPKPKQADTLSFFEYFDRFIEKKKKKNVRTGQKYETAKNHISTYALDKGKTITFEFWNLSTLEEFTDWLYESPRQHSQNTVSKIVDNLRAVLKASFESTPQHHNNKAFQSDSFKVERESRTKRKGRLTFEELDQLINTDFSDNPTLDQARDLFIVGCFTGLRFSDWHKVNKAYIRLDEDGDEVLDILTKKTLTEVYIPVLPELKAILEKYNYKLPKIASQVFNRNIKKAVKAAGIDSTYRVIENIGGKNKVRDHVPKHEMVSSHWGRRSFASNFYEEFNFPVAELMQITGHSTEAQFFGYIEYDRLKMARRAKIRIKQARKERYLKKAQ